jgi:hypothetical protein
MRDADVRASLLKSLAEEYAGDRETRIVQEMGIWAGSVRIDVAVINGRLHGFELKSARDTLERLDRQVELYRQVFDRVTLVVADKHLYKALHKIPEWWGISIAVPTRSDGVIIRDSRPATRNPELVPLQVARLLWRAEALEILERHGLAKGYRSATADALASQLADRLAITTLRNEVRAALKARLGWLGQAVSDNGEMPISTELDPHRPIS